MKSVTLCAVAISLICAASAVTYIEYNDATCATPTASTTAAPNPTVVSLNGCVLITGSSPVEYQKISSCTPNGKVSVAYYSDSGCSNKKSGTDAELDVDKCLAITGGRSRKVTCDSASSASLAFVAIFAAMVTLF